jgi:benzoylformate decarboxylase
MPKTQPSPVRFVRDYIFDILRDLEIGYIFGVPGTNEIPIIDGCDIPANKVQYIECLHENIAMGAAMGYARMTGKPGVLVVHVTPGTGHGIGNLSNAWKSRVPLVILCGQQHNELVTQEPLLASNVVEIATQFTKWSHELRSWEETGLVLQRAFKEALAPPAGPVFISLPWEFTIHRMEPQTDRVRGVTRIPPRFKADPDAIQQAAQALGKSKAPVIIVGDAVGYAHAWPEVQDLAERLGAPVYLEGQSSMANFPNSDYHWQGELPGSQGDTQKRLDPHDVAFLCGFGAQAQITVFKYSDGPLIPEHVKQIYLTNNTWDIGKNAFGEVAVLGDIKATLPELNKLLPKTPQSEKRNKGLQQDSEKRWKAWQAYLDQVGNQEPIRGVVVAAALRDLILERNLKRKFVYVHEAISDAAPFQLFLPFAEPISYYSVEGGSLGWSMPATLGIKLAGEGLQDIEPELVVNAVGDGSALFYPQVWWTAAHRDLPILHIIMNNLEYRTLIQGLGAVVAAYKDDPAYGWQPQTMNPDYLHIAKPNFNFVELASAFGVQNGARVKRPQDVKAALEVALDFVLNQKKAYVLELFSDPAVKPDQPRTKTKALAATIEQPEQPPLDVFYQYHHNGQDEERHQGQAIT